MAVYKIFPDKDTFIYTEVPIANAGYDEMLEIGGYNISEVPQMSRILLHFADREVNDVVSNKIGSTEYSASLNLKIATAYETPISHSVYAYPVYEYWDGGVGKYGDYPWDLSGAAWRYALEQSKGSWTLPHNTVNMPAYVTGSYLEGYPGGGNWYTGSNGISLESSQSFEVNDSVDLDLNVTEAVKLMYTGSISNNGFILKFPSDIEFDITSSVRHKFYSANTNTIYPPTLDLKWDDSSYLTGSLDVLGTDIAEIDITNNKGQYPDIGKQRFRLLARPKFPVRTFTTSSVYKTNYALPQESYWGLKDEFTEEMVIPFDDEFTKISCDEKGSYFDIYMDGLQPERYYRVLVKSVIDGTTAVINKDNVFKVVRNG
jgi:hypothetical protein